MASREAQKAAKKKQREKRVRAQTAQEQNRRLMQKRFPRGRFPVFRYEPGNASQSFIEAVTGILTVLDFRDSQLFAPHETAFFERMKQVGFFAAVKAVRHPDLPQQTPNESAVPLWGFCMGQKVFAAMDREGLLLKFIPFSDVQFVPVGRDFQVKFDAMLTAKTAHGTVYYSKHRPQIELDGKSYTVAFHRHAIEQICNRTVMDWRTYESYGDAYSRYAMCTKFEAASVYNEGALQPAFSIFDECADGFATGHVLRNGIFPDYSPSKSYGVRLGYCPVGIDGTFAAGKTCLWPGLAGTPEYGLLLRSALPREKKDEMKSKLRGGSYSTVVQSGELDVLKWFHDNGVPQIVEMGSDPMPCMNSTPKAHAPVVDQGCLTDADVKRVAEEYLAEPPTPWAMADMGSEGPAGSASSDMAEIKRNALPVASIADPRVCARVLDADVIFGFDTTSGYPSLFYGKDTLQRINQGGVPERMVFLGFWYDDRTDQLEYLHAAVTTIKGSCCYGKD